MEELKKAIRELELATLKLENAARELMRYQKSADLYQADYLKLRQAYQSADRAFDYWSRQVADLKHGAWQEQVQTRVQRATEKK